MSKMLNKGGKRKEKNYFNSASILDSDNRICLYRLYLPTEVFEISESPQVWKFKSIEFSDFLPQQLAKKCWPKIHSVGVGFRYYIFRFKKYIKHANTSTKYNTQYINPLWFYLCIEVQ